MRCFESTLHAGKVRANITLALAISAQAINQRSTQMKKTLISENPAFTFRTFLLRLGLIGDEYKNVRKHLLENLEGDLAWRYDKSTYECLKKNQRTADEYEAWMNEQKKEMESLIGTGDGWYDGQGVFHEFTQESVDAMMDSYKETLENIKKGVLYSKDNGNGDTYSMIPPTEDVVSSYSVDVTKDNGKTVHIGDYSTAEELDKAISDAVKNGQLTQEEADSVQK